jgi:hypothetical protein
VPLTPEMAAHAAQVVVFPFAALEIAFPAGALRLCAAGVPVTFGGKTFLPEDALYGSWASLEGLGEDVGVSAPGLVIGVNAPSGGALAALNDPLAQGAELSIWWGFVNPATGLVIPDPELAFSGFFDRGRMSLGANSRVLELEIVSAWERLFADNEGQRLNDAWLQSIFPGDLGLEFVTGVDQQLPWGGDGPRPQFVTQGGGQVDLGGGIGGAINLWRMWARG